MEKNKVVIRLMIFVVLLIVIIALIFSTMARYQSQAESIGEIEIALYVLDANYQSMNLRLNSMIPRVEPYVHNFSISNYNDVGRTDIALEYTLKIRTTTNLPFIYELYLNQNYNAPNAVNIITENAVELDDDGTYFRRIETAPIKFGYAQNETNLYQLIIYFPESYKSIQYQDVIESVEIIINSRQDTN